TPLPYTTVFRSREARPLRVILVGDRRAEERHEAVAGELGDRSLEAMHALGKQRGDALHDLVEHLGINLLGEVHGALHVGEEDGDLLALALEGGARGEDLLDQVLRGVGRPITRCRTCGLVQTMTASIAERLTSRIRVAAAGARHVAGQACATLATESGTVGIRGVAAGALHRESARREGSYRRGP